MVRVKLGHRQLTFAISILTLHSTSEGWLLLRLSFPMLTYDQHLRRNLNPRPMTLPLVSYTFSCPSMGTHLVKFPHGPASLFSVYSAQQPSKSRLGNNFCLATIVDGPGQRSYALRWWPCTSGSDYPSPLCIGLLFPGLKPGVSQIFAIPSLPSRPSLLSDLSPRSRAPADCKSASFPAHRGSSRPLEKP